MHFFDYELPDRLIAQQPAKRRDESRLLVVHRGDGRIEHRVFRDLPELLDTGDLVVLNDTRVLPARLLGSREKTGGQWEALFLRRQSDGLWELLARTRGHPVSGETFRTALGFRLILRGRTADHHWLVEPDPPGEPGELLARFGEVPLPPYIRKGRAKETDADRYQTVFAEKLGSVAAPTAGLHFTPELLGRLQEKGIGRTHVTLHVGLGTFAPIKAENPLEHAIHREWCEVSEETGAAIRTCRQRGGRVVAVGTTAVRTLETAALIPNSRPTFAHTSGQSREGLVLSGTEENRRMDVEACTGWKPVPPKTGFAKFPSDNDGTSGWHRLPAGATSTAPGAASTKPAVQAIEMGPGAQGEVLPYRGETGLFIHPPFQFRAVDALITNFHLPRTTLLLLVGAFAGSELLRQAYEEAIRREYRFYSYGDAMLVL